MSTPSSTYKCVFGGSHGKLLIMKGRHEHPASLRLTAVALVLLSVWTPRIWFFNVVFPLFIIQGSLVTSYAIETGLSDRSGVTITLLLAIVAFRYVVSEKLPAISYLTLIDRYVLSSFGLAAVIIADQTVQGLGLYNEHRSQLVSVNGWQQDRNGTWSRTEVDVSGHLMLVLSIWLSLHACVVFAILARTAYFFRDEEQWSHSASTLWIGPLSQGHISPHGQSADLQLSEEANSALCAFIAAALDDETADQLPNRYDIRAWTPQKADETVQAAGEKGGYQAGSDFDETAQAAGEKGGYQAASDFVVATFSSRTDATKLLQFAVNAQASEDPSSDDARIQNARDFFRGGKIIVEFLDEKYMSLTTNRTFGGSTNSGRQSAGALRAFSWRDSGALMV